MVTLGNKKVLATDYLARLPNAANELRDPMQWSAISGAAFASAMGRFSQGTTNGAFAAMGINLGTWVPSPLAERLNLPRIRYGYTIKEVLGIYDDADDYIFVADGGHWDNLGLVELLRRKCPTIVCFDASGDTPGSFTTLSEAINLALVELDCIHSFDLSGIDTANDGTHNQLPATSVIEIPFWFNDEEGNKGKTGRIIYANLRLARDQKRRIRRFAQLDKRFPHYSTGDQFLDDQQFEFLVEAGKSAGEGIRAILAKTQSRAPTQLRSRP
jgi:hypothetical protein